MILVRGLSCIGMFKAKSGSFFRKEQERVEELIRDHLLLLVLEHLPHLQPTKAEQDDVWEIVAIEVANILLDENPGNKDDLPLLNGMFVKQIFENLEKQFCRRHHPPGLIQSPESTLLSSFKDRNEHILQELYKLKGLDLKVLSKLSQERFEQIQRDKFNKNFDTKFNTKNILNSSKNHHENHKLELLEKELDKCHKKIDQLTEENKRLLQLNHDLLNQK